MAIHVFTGLPGLGKSREMQEAKGVQMPKYQQDFAPLATLDRIQYEMHLLQSVMMLGGGNNEKPHVYFDRFYFPDEMVFPRVFHREYWASLESAVKESYAIITYLRMVHYTVEDEDYEDLSKYLNQRERSPVDGKWTPRLLELADKRFHQVYRDALVQVDVRKRKPAWENGK